MLTFIYVCSCTFSGVAEECRRYHQYRRYQWGQFHYSEDTRHTQTDDVENDQQVNIADGYSAISGESDNT